jgi:hypothetical protein
MELGVHRLLLLSQFGFQGGRERCYLIHKVRDGFALGSITVGQQIVQKFEGELVPVRRTAGGIQDPKGVPDPIFDQQSRGKAFHALVGLALTHCALFDIYTQLSDDRNFVFAWSSGCC